MFAGTFHRRKSPTQSDSVALKQCVSQEIWGRTPRWGHVPTVEAYAGPIDTETKGVEFDTSVDPEPYGSPFQAKWYLGKTHGVEERKDSAGEQFACITAVVRLHQP